MKANLALELTQIREQLNELRRREKLLRDYFLNDLEKYGKVTKKYGEITISLFEHERERVNLDALHLNYPKLYEDLLSTYLYTTLKCQKKMED